MKKISTLLNIFALIIGFAYTSNAQLVAQNATTYLNGTNDLLMTAHVTILTSGSSSVSVSVARISQALAPHHFSYFCWTQFYDTSVSVSPDVIDLGPGESTSVFNGDLSPQFHDGI